MPTTADMRRFIMDIFNDEELTTFCFDYFRKYRITLLPA